MNKILFCGCSFVAGTGFELNKQEPNLWVNLLKNHNKFKHLELINVAQGGRSNSGIFQDAVFNLSKYKFEYAIVSWTSVPRYELSLGLETYPTRMCVGANTQQSDHNLNNINYPKNYLQNINDRFVALSHPHEEILNLIHYVNSLINLCNLTDTKIYFVNALCPWDENYFDKLQNVMPSDYTNFTQQIINVDHRNDQEINDLYIKIHTEYTNAGGIQKNHWLNLYSSLIRNRIDTNQDGFHPGIKSNQLFYDLLTQAI